MKIGRVLAGLAGTGMAAGIGASVAGTSAASMTTTLASIGGLVGGGMAAGITAVAVAPIAVCGLVLGATAVTRLLK